MLRQILSDSSPRPGTQVSAIRVRFWESLLRRFPDEACNVGSKLIARTLLQQENRVHRSDKKAVAHQGKDDLAQARVYDAPVEGVDRFLVQRANSASDLP